MFLNFSGIIWDFRDEKSGLKIPASPSKYTNIISLKLKIFIKKIVRKHKLAEDVINNVTKYEFVCKMILKN